MSIERDATLVGNVSPTEAAQKETRAERKARLVTVLDRSPVNARFQVDLPAHLHGEWVRKDPLEVDRMRALGYEIDSEFALKRSLHSDGSSKAEIGDVVFMVTDKENYELIQEVQREQMERVNGRPGDVKSQKEERDYSAVVRDETGGVVPTINEGSTKLVDKSAIEAALGVKK